tara:strand:+ start:676 stop:1098 length:423 start_codon:yes stop_codon:yes gene_type:complete
MLINTSYYNEKQEKEIKELVGKPFGLFKRIKNGGVGSGRLLITKADKEIENLLILDQNLNYCNIEMRPNGIIVYFRILLETYALVIPYFKLVIFKVDSTEYTLNIDQKFLKIKVKGKNDHGFFRKILEQKAVDYKNYKIN